MEACVTLWQASWLLALIAMVQTQITTEILKITRHNSGDIFSSAPDKNRPCTEETCIGVSSGTAVAISGKDLCTCRCHQHLPAFRDDLQICVDDINECILAPFVGGSTSQQIPFVFLPLKDQIIHPSKEISFTGIHKPVCAVSEAKFLTEAGWADLRKPLDNDVPFRLFRDEGRTFLQWIGEPELRNKMSGRMVLVHLMCRELEDQPLAAPNKDIFGPCVAFRIVGTPSKIHSNVTEVAFSLDAHSGSEKDSLSVSEYVAIGICSVLLGLIYVASIFLYLHLKKRNSLKNSQTDRKNQNIVTVEEGVVKNNPLLSLTHHFGPAESAYSDTNSSDNENAPDLLQNHDKLVTSAIVHSQQRTRSRCSSPQGYSSSPEAYQENSSFERLPEENVSIVETLEDRPDSIKALSGAARKKLYFNPAYFEPHLLIAPPPAALEFLDKIREVIDIAKQKMSTKRYVPTLLHIPEEESNYSVEPSYDFSRPSSRRGSVISLKRENSRRKSCSGCPGCEPQDISAVYQRLPDFPSLAACQNCTAGNESKEHSIQKWLEDIPVLRLDERCGPVATPAGSNQRRIRSPTRSLPDSRADRALSPRPASEATARSHRKPAQLPRKEKVLKPMSPPPPVPVERRTTLPPPDMIHEAIEMENQADETRIPTLTKKQMNAVINELTVHKNMLEAANRELARRASAGYETDSLERNGKHPGYSTPSEYAEVASSQASPSLSTALPVDEEITMQNAIFNTQTGHLTLSKLSSEAADGDDHDYELVVLKNHPQLFTGSPAGSYSLVSEVYVNNGYNYGSNPSSPSESNCSTMDKKSLKVRYEGGVEKPGKLLIEVEDCLDHYIPVNDSDEFEPDTLDRPNKYEKLSVAQSFEESVEENSNQILLRTTGSFKQGALDVNANHVESSNFHRVLGSLREMYQEKKLCKELEVDEDGKLLTLEERHSKRQRIKTTSNGPVVPPDLIPPPPPIYERPKPPIKVPKAVSSSETPNHPKNEPDRSANCIVGTPALPEYKLIQTHDFISDKNQCVFHSTIQHSSLKRLQPFNLRPEDPGYLSTDSNESRLRVLLNRKLLADQNGSETDESLGDGHSESGAESVETHSVFFGRYSRKPGGALSSSLDSGVLNCEDGQSSSDSETVSYTTVVPVSSNNNSLVMR
ncbi:uncharacterized protein LOC109542571 [Dendroctonus ponderosae]|uniref:uncharacterized protein LOC109542571 n=1 Tax=Dendroctonus ponderosae TaxID=77166 RepID=UPI002034D028|nr:uncharacterized protein LOC109542571 [Dendroctonus ponderosae]